MLIQDRFISTSELQQNVAKTIDKAKKEDIIVIRNNKLEAAIISIDKYNQFLEYMEWKKLSDALDKVPIEYISDKDSLHIMEMLSKAKKNSDLLKMR
ncbi:MAG: type II toxin-antitoxin system Phd/YefM family antitoxin [Acetivibrionales bacterium]|jgi:PHD/YefM family antitoxin component YafN of YafNO toxin-antitoxin module